MEKLYLFFGEAREGEINHYINDIGLQETKNRFIVYGEKILGVSDGRLNRDNTVVVLHSEWQSGKSLSQKTDEELYEDARWYLHAQRLSDGMRPYNETKITFGNWLAGLIVLPVYVSLSSDKPANDEKKPEITKKQAVDDRSQTNSMRKNDTPDDLLRWENVYVFISSTFNDMHAERDYLVKRVFPELRLWCEQRKLKLVDVDLRWGVTEADSVQNKRTVEVCLNSIDQCRPFFLCLLGQRRGWVPQRCEIAADTMDAFPGLADNLGHSMTELEIIHALMEPFREIPNDRNTVPQKCALLYCRKPDFLQEITSDSIKKIFTDDLHVTEISDWKRFVGDTIQTSVRECREYSAFWDKRLRTPELSFALTNGADDTAGRLSDFRCGKKVLAQQVIEDLKQAITDRFGEREIAGDHPLHKELDEQAMFLKAASEGFIEREDDFLAINRYIQSDDTRPFVIAAKAGIGKTSYLAHFIKTCDYKVYYRFIGKSDEANASETLALSLLDELACEHRIQGSVPRDPDTLLRVYPSLLAQAAQSGGFVIVIDALDQLSGGAETADFMLGSLPQGVKLIASIKQEGSQAYISRISGYAQVLDIRPFDSMEDRRRLVHAFLGSYLKKLDDNKMEVLLSAEETKNPLYLKVLLRELRVFGSHEGLMKVIRDHFGDTPVSAFSAVLARLEHDPAYCQVSMEALTENVFGWLCCTPSGLSVEELAQLLVRFGVAADRDAANDAVNLLFRQLRPYLAARGGRVGFFFESFKTACKQRYTLRKPEAKWHAELALYFSEQPISDPHRLLEQAYQYYHAGMTEALMAYLFSYRYMENKLARFDVERLVEDYAYYACESTGIMIGFLRICASVLRQDPIQLAGRLYGHLSGLDDAHCEKLLLDAKRTKAARGDAWLQPEFPCFRQPMGASIREYRTDSALGTDVNLILNDTHFVVGLGKHQIAVWCIDSDRIVKRIGTDACHVAAIKAAPDGTGFCALLVLDQSMHLKIWSSAGFQAICTIEIANYYRTTKYGSSCYATANTYAYTWDSKAIMIKDSYGEIKLFDASSGALLSAMDYREEINAYGICDAGYIAIGNLHPQRNHDRWRTPGFKHDRNPIRIIKYNADTHQLEGCPMQLAGHYDSVTDICLSPNGDMAASADGNGQIRLWDVVSGELKTEMDGDRDTVALMQFIHGGAELLVLRANGSAAILDTEFYSVKNQMAGLGEIVDAKLFGDEAHCVLIMKTGCIRIVNLMETKMARTTVQKAIRSIGILQERGWILASTYQNYIEPEMVPSETCTVEGALHLFAVRDHAYIGQRQLSGCDNLDFVYLDPCGRFAVSKACMTQRTPSVKYWPFDAGFLDHGEELGAEMFAIAQTTPNLLLEPNRYCFSSDGQYLCAYDGLTHTASVFKTKNGRLLGRVALKKKWKDSFSDRQIEFEVTSGGTVLYALYPRDGVLEVYQIAKQKRLACKRLKGFATDEYIDGQDYHNNVLQFSNDGKKLFYASWKTAVLIDVRKSKAEFQLNRYDKKAESQYHDIDTFAAISDDARLLALSRVLVHGNHKDNLIRTDVLEIWNMRTEKMIAQFYTGGKTSNLLFDSSGKAVTFGLSNGFICRLLLKNDH